MAFNRNVAFFHEVELAPVSMNRSIILALVVISLSASPAMSTAFTYLRCDISIIESQNSKITNRKNVYTIRFSESPKIFQYLNSDNYYNDNLCVSNKCKFEKNVIVLSSNGNSEGYWFSFSTVISRINGNFNLSSISSIMEILNRSNQTGVCKAINNPVVILKKPKF